MSEALVYRTPAALRWLLGALGMLSGFGAGRAAWLAAERAQPSLLLAAGLLAAPCLLAGAAVRFRWVIGPEGLRLTTLRGTRLYAWSSVRCLDRLRVSFSLETDAGPVQPRWLGRRDRERAFEAIVARAGLTPLAADLPWGVRARFVPRGAIVPISLVQRRERRQG